MCKNYKGQIGRKYGNGQKRAMTQRARNGGFCDTVFQNKDDPDYKPNYGRIYTPRQMKIMNEELALTSHFSSLVAEIAKPRVFAGLLVLRNCRIELFYKSFIALLP